MIKERSFIKLLAILPIVFIPAVVALIAYMVFDAEKTFFNSSLAHMKTAQIEVHESAVRSKVNNLVDLAAYRKSVIDAELHSRIQQRVEDAYQIAINIHQQYADTPSEKTVQNLIVNALRPLVWNNGESFIWILDFDGVFQLAPEYLRHLEGSSIIGFKDASGREVIKEEIQIAQSQGEGFLWDTFTKPNEDSNKQFQQLAYVKKFGFYDWYLGSSEYLDTATKITDTSLLTEIGKVSQGTSDYVFVIRQNGELLLNFSRPDLTGKNMNDVGNPKLLNLYQQIVQASKIEKGGFIEYSWLNPTTQQPELKRTFVKAVPGSDWIIGSGFYVDELQSQLQPQQVELFEQNQHKMRNLAELSVLSVLIAILISMLLSFISYKILNHYRQALFNKNEELNALNFDLEQKVFDRTVELEELNAELKDLATTDSLTGIHNRYSCMKAIQEQIQQVTNLSNTCSLIIFDADYFKKINDTYGHDVGDQVLVELVRVVQKNLRDSDVFCRFGGEEFMVLLPHTLLQDAVDLAEKLRIVVEAHDFPIKGNFTISLGVSQYFKGQEKAQFIKAADLALYEAKHNGRNRVSVSK